MDVRATTTTLLVASWISVAVVMIVRAPFRANAVEQLATSPQFLAEALFRFAAGVLLLRAGFELGIPDTTSSTKRTVSAVGITLAWIGILLFGLTSPALEPSMLGKREGCEIETFSLSIPLLVAGLLALRRFAPLNRVYAGAVMGAAAGAVPALLMHFACMYDPHHILTHHIAGAVGSIGVGALLGPLVLRRL